MLRLHPVKKLFFSSGRSVASHEPISTQTPQISFTNKSLSLSMMKLQSTNKFTFTTFTNDFISSMTDKHEDLAHHEPVE